MSLFPTPYGGQNRTTLEKREYIIGISLALLIFLHIVLYTFEFRHLNNTLGTRNLLIWALILGTLLGIVIANKYASKEFELFEQMRIYVIIVVLVVIAMPLWISLTNRVFSPHPVQFKASEFVTSRAFIASRSGNFDPGQGKVIDGYEITFIHENRLYVYQADHDPFPGAEEGDHIEVPFRKGLWGWWFIYNKNVRM